MLQIVSLITLAILATAILIALVRLVRGPTFSDRIVAMDLLGVLVLGLNVVGSGSTGERGFLDAALVIALIGFVGTVAYARYVEKEAKR